MSMFSIPDELMPDVKNFEAMTSEMTAILPREMASAANLFASIELPDRLRRPLSVLGWRATVRPVAGGGLGHGRSVERMFSPLYDEFGSDSGLSRPKRSPAAKAKSATRS